MPDIILESDSLLMVALQAGGESLSMLDNLLKETRINEDFQELQSTTN